MPLFRLMHKAVASLEVVVMRCLEREPQRRYSSAAALADELGRHLKGEPICDFEAG
jgi:eukaryotic-like serine/threonine-protein kinase